MFETKPVKTLISNMRHEDRELVARMVERFPFLYIEEEAFDINGRPVNGCFGLHSSEPGRDTGEAWRYYYELKKGAANV
jgi:hypothetical protein